LKLVHDLERLGVPILGSGAEAIDLAEDRDRFGKLLDSLEIAQPRSAMAANLEEARKVAAEVGYPVLVRPSYVLGGRAMAIVSDAQALDRFVAEALEVSDQRPVLIDQFLEDAVEVDVDCLGDGEKMVVAGIMQHIEEAGVHSGDSACVLPPYKVSLYHLTIMRDYAQALGKALKVKGLMNVQMAIKEDQVYVIEVNPRASRTVPFVAKATGFPLARLAARVMAGETLAQVGFTEEPSVEGFFVKEALLPFRKFPGADSLLGPEMRSTGEVMGHDKSFGWAFAKSQVSAGCALPNEGAALITVNDFDKGAMLKIARDLHRLGFALIATPGTASFFSKAGLPVESCNKVSDGSPHVVDAIRGGRVSLVINTPLTGQAYSDGRAIRRAAIEFGLPMITTTSAAWAAVSGIRAQKSGDWRVESLQDHHA
jgi:carbamoyl-phosphate synthase large subunit